MSGRLTCGKELLLAPPISLTRTDIRQLQLAKGAIAAGVRILLAQSGASMADLTHVYLAGAFGNYGDRASARRIGLLDFPTELIHSVGTTALRGAKMAFFARTEEERAGTALRRCIEHRSLSANPDFQDLYMEAMRFPLA